MVSSLWSWTYVPAATQRVGRLVYGESSSTTGSKRAARAEDLGQYPHKKRRPSCPSDDSARSGSLKIEDDQVIPDLWTTRRRRRASNNSEKEADEAYLDSLPAPPAALSSLGRVEKARREAEECARAQIETAHATSCEVHETFYECEEAFDLDS